jgi:hypothetical protein
MTAVAIAALCYVVGTFPLAYLWHLRLFGPRYEALGIYRENPSPPLGLASMVIQGIVFGLAYVGAVMPAAEGWLARAALYALAGGVLSWSFTTLAWAAKARIDDLDGFVRLETAFTVVQWLLVGGLTAALVT